MSTEELVTVNVFGATKVLIQIDPNWREGFNQYQAGFDTAPDKLEYNRQMLRDLHARYFPHG